MTRLAYVIDASGARATIQALYASEQEAWEDSEERGLCNAGYVFLGDAAAVGDRIWVTREDVMPRPDLAMAGGARP